MTIRQLRHLCKLAEQSGFTTALEVYEYKIQNRIKNNADLLRALYTKNSGAHE